MSCDRSRRRRLPTPDELRIAPELASLAALESAIELAILALVAAQPELWPTDDGHDAVASPAAQSADRVITTAQALASALAGYRLVRLDENDDRSF